MDESLNENKAAGAPSGLNVWLGLTFQEKVKRAERAKIGETWRNNKTGRWAIIMENNFVRGVYLKHESGRMGYIQQHYFAGDYTPNDEVRCCANTAQSNGDQAK